MRYAQELKQLEGKDEGRKGGMRKGVKGGGDGRRGKECRGRMKGRRRR